MNFRLLLALFFFVGAVFARVDWQDLHENYSFDDYLTVHPKSYVSGSPEYQKRKAIFEEKLKAARDHNQAGHSWKMSLYEWSDLTDAELKKLYGKTVTPDPLVTLIQEQEKDMDNEDDEQFASLDSFFTGLPDTLDWSQQGHTTGVKKQCGGSCYAVSTVEMLESALAKTYGLKQSEIPNLSVQEVMACSSNPKHCGGTGGCGGSTVELAMDFVKKNGLSFEDQYPLEVRNGKKMYGSQMCPCSNKCLNELVDKKRVKVHFDTSKTLPKNKMAPLVKAVQEGPVAITLSADNWFGYGGGLYDCPNRDAVINHAVVLIGYGTLNGRRYWKVRNSWGDEWGENGYIRIAMKEDEHRFCGTDSEPKEGTGCDGGPPKVKVCGSCGILFDSVTTGGVHLKDENGNKMNAAAVKKLLKSKKIFLEESGLRRND